MTGPPSVIVEDLHVVYETIIDRRRSVLARLRDRKFGRRYREIHAVSGVSFKLYQGETVGIIGSNGSGKSTLLAALTGLIPIRSGTIRVRSRPTLLGVGAAMRPPLSGRRNIYIGAVALGLSRQEIEDKEEAIIEFSGLEDSIDLPVKGYSSGMKARLAFSIATCISPEILLIDEALAVGDRAFKKRSRERLEEIRNGAGSVVIVSHAPGDMRATDRVIWLEGGEIRMEGDPDTVADAYDEYADSLGMKKRRT